MCILQIKEKFRSNLKKKKKIETSYHPEENSLRGSRIVRDM